VAAQCAAGPCDAGRDGFGAGNLSGWAGGGTGGTGDAGGHRARRQTELLILRMGRTVSGMRTTLSAIVASTPISMKKRRSQSTREQSISSRSAASTPADIRRREGVVPHHDGRAGSVRPPMECNASERAVLDGSCHFAEHSSGRSRVHLHAGKRRA
jgi:hypothetical protein